jgi:hypothetical protein
MSNVSDGKWEFPSAGVTQLVECDLAKVDVAGSNPVSRSKNLSHPAVSHALPAGVASEALLGQVGNRLATAAQAALPG